MIVRLVSSDKQQKCIEKDSKSDHCIYHFDILDDNLDVDHIVKVREETILKEIKICYDGKVINGYDGDVYELYNIG